MGNTTSLESGTNNSYKINLGALSSIRVSKTTSPTKTNEFGEAVEKQNVTYVVNGEPWNLTLTKIRPPGPAAGSNNKRGHKFIITMSNDIAVNARIEVQIVEGGRVVVTYARASFGTELESPSSIRSWLTTFAGKTRFYDLTSKNNLITNSTADGGIVESCMLVKGVPFRSNSMALIVLQLNKKGRDQSAYMVTVAHYFIHLGRTDIGFSMVAQIHGEEGLKLEGPIQHPGTALYQVMEQSKRNARWIPRACPHCADGYQQRQSSEPKKKSESNSEEDSNKAVAEFTMLKHSEAILSNSGVTIGNGNGSMLFNSDKMEVYVGGKRI